MAGSWLADDLYAGVARLMRSSSAEDWEPELYQKVAAVISPVKE